MPVVINPRAAQAGLNFETNSGYRSMVTKIFQKVLKDKEFFKKISQDQQHFKTF